MRQVARKGEEGETGADRADMALRREWVGETCHVDGGNETKARPDGLDWNECLFIWR